MYTNDYNHSLISVAKSKNPSVRQLKKLLMEEANVNYQTMEDGYTALMFVVQAHHDRIVEFLLCQGANPLLKNNDNKIASNLISCGSSIFPILKDFELLFATMNNDLPLVKQIIKDGAFINFQGAGGYSSLMIAVEENLFAMVEFLFSKGADLSLTHSDGKNIFDLVIDSNMLYLLKEINKLDKGIQENSNKNLYHFFRENSLGLIDEKL